MTPLVQTTTLILGLGTIVLQVCLFLFVVSIVFFRRHKDVKILIRFLSTHILSIGFIVSLLALLASLFYSNIAGFAPCELCWWQRIFIYPQVIIFGIALLWERRSKKIDFELIALQTGGLSLVSALIGIYQYWGSTFSPHSLACAASAVSCAKIYFTVFGYITLPLMALTTSFALLAISLSRIFISEK